jgi:hypothetical protein
MIRVDQQFLHDPENGVKGDCFRACIASVLELPIEVVPHVAALESSRWMRCMEGFLGGLDVEIEWAEGMPPNGVWAIATVQSPRNPEVKHSVIYRDGVMVHDPHPSRAGGVGDPTGYFFLVPDGSTPHHKTEGYAGK